MATSDSTTDEPLDGNSDQAADDSTDYALTFRSRGAKHKGSTPLEDLIERERTRLILASNVLGCTAVAINNDRIVDESPFVYGDVIELAREMIDLATDQLDSEYVRELCHQLVGAQREFNIKGDRHDRMTIKVAGHTKQLLTINTGICECGDITDGIFLAHYDEWFPEDWIEDPDGGGWVMAWADLEAIYQSALAKRARKSRQDSPSEGDAAGKAPADAHETPAGGGL